MVPGARGCSQQSVDLGLAECAHFLALCARSFDRIGRVRRQHPPQDRLLERATQDHVDLPHRPRRKAALQELAERMLDVLGSKRTEADAADERAHPPNAEVVVEVGLRPYAVANGLRQPTLQVLVQGLVAADDEPSGVGLSLGFIKATLDDLARCRGEELLPSVRHADVGDPSSVAAAVDRSLTEAAPRYSRSGHGVDILPST